MISLVRWIRDGTRGETLRAPEPVFPPRRRPGDDDGLGVPVPAGPKPRVGGAAAAPPARERRELVEA